MYEFIGNTGIKSYDFFNAMGFYVMFIFNILHLKHKKQFISGLTKFIGSKILRKENGVIYSIFVLIELMASTYLLYFLSGLGNGIFRDLFDTGANYYGNLLLGPIPMFLLFYLASVNPLRELDFLTVGIPLNLVFVKTACFCAGCCRGFECSWGWYYPTKDATMFPTQLLEALMALFIFIFLMKYRKKAKDGTLYPIYMILYSTTRFFTEFTRIEENVFLIFKTYHLLSLLGIVVGIVWLLIVKKYSNQILEFYKKAPFPWAREKITDYRQKKKIKKSSNINKNGVPPKNSKNKEGHPQIRMWILIWSLGLMGQIGWTVESLWFNTFVYEKIDKNPSIITPMLIFSALATTVSIFLFGTLSDRTGKRRHFISIGYAVWGVLIILFGLTQFIPNRFLLLTAFCLVFGDMLVSFFGSMSTDVGFAAWTTDVMKEDNKGKIGAAIAVQCVLGGLLGNIIGGYIIGTENNYLRLFIVVGSVLACFGVISAYMFTKKDDIKPSVRGTFKEQFLSVFDYKNVLKQKELIWVHISIIIFFVGYDVYSPHIGNYLIHYLGFTADKMGIIQAVPLVLAMLVTLPVSKFIDKNKFVSVSFGAIISGIIGILFVFLVNPENIDTTKIFDIRLFLGIFFIGVSYVVMLQCTKVWSKKLYPSDSKGQYEGLWAISFLLLPMFFGSNISQMIIKTGDSIILNDLTGQMEYIPDNRIFYVGVIISTLSIVPLVFTRYVSKKNIEKDKKLRHSK